MMDSVLEGARILQPGLSAVKSIACTVNSTSIVRRSRQKRLKQPYLKHSGMANKESQTTVTRRDIKTNCPISHAPPLFPSHDDQRCGHKHQVRMGMLRKSGLCGRAFASDRLSTPAAAPPIYRTCPRLRFRPAPCQPARASLMDRRLAPPPYACRVRRRLSGCSSGITEYPFRLVQAAAVSFTLAVFGWTNSRSPSRFGESCLRTWRRHCSTCLSLVTSAYTLA